MVVIFWVLWDTGNQFPSHLGGVRSRAAAPLYQEERALGCLPGEVFRACPVWRRLRRDEDTLGILSFSSGVAAPWRSGGIGWEEDGQGFLAEPTWSRSR